MMWGLSFLLHVSVALTALDGIWHSWQAEYLLWVNFSELSKLILAKAREHLPVIFAKLRVPNLHYRERYYDRGIVIISFSFKWTEVQKDEMVFLRRCSSVAGLAVDLQSCILTSGIKTLDAVPSWTSEKTTSICHASSPALEIFNEQNFHSSCIKIINKETIKAQYLPKLAVLYET